MKQENAEISDEVVVVDDDELTLELVQRTLKGTDIPVKCFQNEEHALEYLKENLGRVLLIDQRMPRLSGLELLLQLSRHTKLDQTQVYLCSALELPEPVFAAAQVVGAIPLSKDVYGDKSKLIDLIAEKQAPAVAAKSS